MTSLRQRLRAPHFGPYKSTLSTIFSSKIARVVLSSLLLLSLLGGFVTVLQPLRHGSSANSKANAAIAQIAEAIKGAQGPKGDPSRGRLHLLIPATSSNPDLCKVLLSATILDYPAPIFINWGDPEQEDPYVQHLAKVEGILNYLDNLEMSSEYGQDLVLIIDGYDIWFQLRPDVLIKRYYEMTRAADNRTRAMYGEARFNEHDMRQTIIFGPDKICWPIDFRRPACWAVPEADLPPYAFGPATSEGFQTANMPRWLNSGTIMGPVQDLRTLFRATLNRIHTNHVTDSDQFYFAELFGEQEYTRLTKKPGLLDAYRTRRYFGDVYDGSEDHTPWEPKLEAGARTEYHIGIDYRSSAFQTLAFWKQYLAWMRPADSLKVPSAQGAMYLQDRATPYSPHVLDLPADIKASKRPFESLRVSGYAYWDMPWDDVELNYNTVTGEIPVVIHFTGEKNLRMFWWNRIWFQAGAYQLRLAGREFTSLQISPQPIEGVTWFKAEPEDANEVSQGGVGGAWSDTGGWFSWNRVCKPFEDAVFYRPGDDWRHPPPKDNLNLHDGWGLVG